MRMRGEKMNKNAICKCGHSWVYHFGLDPSKLNKHRKDDRDGRKQPCEHYSGCECEDWEEVKDG